MIIWLPRLKNEKACISLERQKGFSGQQLRRNLEWLKKNIEFDDYLFYVEKLFGEWQDDFVKIADSQWIRETLTEKINVDTNYIQEEEYANCQRIVKENLEKGMKNKIGNMLFLSDSHATTEIIIKTFKELNPKPRIGVVCFDAHADLYDSGEIPWKGNVFSTLLEKEVISTVLFVGIPIYRQAYFTVKLPQKMKDKIFFLDWNGTKEEIDSVLSKWKPLPTHIFYSFDVDGLDSRKMKYTAMEYCSFHVLSALAAKDFTMETDKGQLMSLLRDCVMQPIQSLNNPEVTVYKNLYGIGDEGVPLSKVAEITQRIEDFAKNKHVQIGLPLNKNSRLVGDIVELFGPDFEGRTAKAVAEVIDILTMNTKN